MSIYLVEFGKRVNAINETPSFPRFDWPGLSVSMWQIRSPLSFFPLFSRMKYHWAKERERWSLLIVNKLQVVAYHGE